MKQYLPNLKLETLDKLRTQFSESSPPFLNLPLVTDPCYLENSIEAEVILLQEVVTDGLVMGTVRTSSKLPSLRVKIYGTYVTSQVNKSHGESDVSSCPAYQSILKSDRAKEQSQLFLEEEAEIGWKGEDSQGQFEFLVEPTLPNSISFQLGAYVKTVSYLVEAKCDGLHYVSPVLIRYSNDLTPTEKEVSYVATDFQLMRSCCNSRGVFRVESILPTNLYTAGNSLIGRINYFRKSKGALNQLSSCRIDLVARIKWCRKGSKQYSYVPVASKTVTLDAEPEYGMVVSHYRLEIPRWLPPTTDNMLFAITYFTMLTPKDGAGQCTVKFLDEHIRELYLNDS